MGKPKKCDFRPSPFIEYITTTSSTTTPIPEDFSNYITIPNSGSICPTTTTTTTSTTTTLPPINPNYPCVSYSFLPYDDNGSVITYAPCDNNNSINQIVVSTVQRVDFCAERSAPVAILSGNGRLVYNGGCFNFFFDPNQTTTTTTTTTTTSAPQILIPPTSLQFEDYDDKYPENCKTKKVWWTASLDDWRSYLQTPPYYIWIDVQIAFADYYAPDLNNGNLSNDLFILTLYSSQINHPGDFGDYKRCCGFLFYPPPCNITNGLTGNYYQFRIKIMSADMVYSSPYTYSRVATVLGLP